jgi:hypothetical protein
VSPHLLAPATFSLKTVVKIFHLLCCLIGIRRQMQISTEFNITFFDVLSTSESYGSNSLHEVIVFFNSLAYSRIFAARNLVCVKANRSSTISQAQSTLFSHVQMSNVLLLMALSKIYSTSTSHTIYTTSGIKDIRAREQRQSVVQSK